MVVSIGVGVWIEHLVFIGRDKSDKRMANNKEAGVLVELSRQLVEVPRLWGLVNVPVRHFLDYFSFATLWDYLARVLIPLPPASPSQLSFPFPFLLLASSNCLSTWGTLARLMCDQARKLENQVVEATLAMGQ